MKTIYQHILKHLQVGNPVILATVTGATGSTPQKPGSSALFGMDGLLAGTVGGGLVEGEITKIVQHSFKNKESGHYHFNLDAEQGEEGAICGGEISVLVDGTPEAHHTVFEEMDHFMRQRRPGGVLTLVGKSEHDKLTVKRFWVDPEQPENLHFETDPETEKMILEGIRNGKTGQLVEIISGKHPGKGEAHLFLEPVFPLPSLIIAGAGHIGRAVSHLGHLLDFEITVIDDRPEHANRENLPEADHILVGDIGKTMESMHLDKDTYVVIVTRGHEHDAEALRPCIGSNSAYTGMIGSKNKVATLKKRFIEASWATPEQWQKLHTPIGIEIGSKTVQEIAVSIAAQLVQVRYKTGRGHA